MLEVRPGAHQLSGPFTSLLLGLWEIHGTCSKELARLKVWLKMKREDLEAQPRHHSTGIRKGGLSLWLPESWGAPTSTSRSNRPVLCTHKPQDSRGLKCPTASPGRGRPCPLRSSHRASWYWGSSPPGGSRRFLWGEDECLSQRPTVKRSRTGSKTASSDEVAVSHTPGSPSN